MKKLILAMVLIGVLVGSILGGLALAAPGATLSVDPGIGDVGTQVKVTGKDWTSGVLVNIYWDVEDDVHLLATKMSSDKGRFNMLFNIGATSLGVHDIIAVQGTTRVSDTFTLEITQPVDERTWGVLDDLSSEIAAIEGKLDNPTFGLAEIKAEVANIESQLADPATGLEEIKAEVINIEDNVGEIGADVSTIQGKVEDIQNDLSSPAYGLEEIKGEIANIEQILTSLPRIEKFSSGEISVPPGSDADLLKETFNELRHINITPSYLHSPTFELWVIADFDGDGLYDRSIRPMGDPSQVSVAPYEFEAFGFWVFARNGWPDTRTCFANAVTIY